MSNFPDRRRFDRSPKTKYGAALAAVIVALLAMRWMGLHFTPTPATLFLCAILLSSLWGGLGPGLLATFSSILMFEYLYVAPHCSFAVEVKEIPRLVMFSVTAIFVGGLGTAQNASFKSLRSAYKRLADAIKALKQINQALQHENAERRNIHEQLRFSEAFLYEGQKISHTGSWRWNMRSKELVWSDEHYRIFGYSPGNGRMASHTDELTPTCMFTQRVHPDDLPHVREIVNRAYAEKSRFECEYRIILPELGIRYLYGVGCPITPGLFESDDYIGTTVDITARKETERQLEESQRLLRQLADRGETVREEERKRLARELHDDVAQYLSALRMKISILDIEFGTCVPPLRLETQSMVALVDTTIQMTRNAISALRPAALDSGIVPALEWLRDDFIARTGIDCRLRIGVTDSSLPDHCATTVFRVAQESLRNVAKHAAASEVDICFNRSECVYILKIRDNGKGFDPALKNDHSFGLLGIRERILMLGGTVDIQTAPGCGAEIQVVIPVFSNVSAK